jgi:hypothetical protein
VCRNIRWSNRRNKAVLNPGGIGVSSPLAKEGGVIEEIFIKK